MNTKLTVGILALVIVIGGGVYYWTQLSPAVSPAATSGGKTYTSVALGFSFQHPATWAVTETSDSIELKDPTNGASTITFYGSPLQAGANTTCPLSNGDQAPNSVIDSAHLVDCKNLVNRNEVQYAQETIAGMSTAKTYKEQQIRVDFLTKKDAIQVIAPSIDASGQALSTAEFDAVVQSLKVM